MVQRNTSIVTDKGRDRYGTCTTENASFQNCEILVALAKKQSYGLSQAIPIFKIHRRGRSPFRFL
jgi:hypothetical protein